MLAEKKIYLNIAKYLYQTNKQINTISEPMDCKIKFDIIIY